MSLPGLELGEPTAPGTQVASAAPVQHSLPKGSEWRFEVGFGSTVRVKVCFLLHFYTWSCMRCVEVEALLVE